MSYAVRSPTMVCCKLLNHLIDMWIGVCVWLVKWHKMDGWMMQRYCGACYGSFLDTSLCFHCFFFCWEWEGGKKYKYLCIWYNWTDAWSTAILPFILKQAFAPPVPTKIILEEYTPTLNSTVCTTNAPPCMFLVQLQLTPPRICVELYCYFHIVKAVHCWERNVKTMGINVHFCGFSSITMYIFFFLLGV